MTVKLGYDRNRVLEEFTRDVQSVFGAELVSIVLFGSGAENRIRPISDLNLIVVLRSFPEQLPERLAEILQYSRATVALSVMFLLEGEIGEATEAFAVKFSDIQRRRRVLFGPDPFSRIEPSREAKLRAVRQSLLNQILRLRSRFAQVQGRPAEAVKALAQVAGPLRSAAFELLALEGNPAPNNRDALTRVLGSEHSALAADISRARESGRVEQPIARLRQLLGCVQQMYTRAGQLP